MLGFVSMLMDVSSEMIHSVLPIYFVTVLGTSTLTVGVVEGIAEATAAITKVFSGVLADWFGKRKLLMALGYGLAAFTKPVFALADSLGWIIGARFVDRVGKGIRGAPRDALIADLAPASLRAASFGLRQSLDTIGAVAGPLAAIFLMWKTGNDFKLTFWVAVVPAFLSLALVFAGVREPALADPPERRAPPLARSELRRLGSSYWWIVATGAVLTLARFSEAFLILRAQAAGLPIALAPAIMIAMNVVYALAAYPAGALADKVNRVTVLMFGGVLLIAGDLFLALSSGVGWAVAGVVLWGLHMAFTQGVFSALIADASPAGLRGTAYGMFNLMSGIAMLAASAIAGALWDLSGPRATFLAGAAFAAVALAGLGALRRVNLSRDADGDG